MTLDQWQDPIKIVRTFVCLICKFQSTDNSLFNRHKLTHGPEDRSRAFPCAQCDYSATSLNNLKKHEKCHIPKEERKLKCPHCSYKTHIGSSLRNHLFVHCEDRTCRLCGYEALSGNGMRIHAKLHQLKDGVLRCEICNYLTDKEDCFQKHRTFGCHQTGPRDYQCDRCPFSSRFRSEVMEHKRESHQGEAVNSTQDVLQTSLDANDSRDDVKLNIRPERATSKTSDSIIVVENEVKTINTININENNSESCCSSELQGEPGKSSQQTLETIQNSQKVYECKICRRVTQKCNLRSHLEQNHGGILSHVLSQRGDADHVDEDNFEIASFFEIRSKESDLQKGSKAVKKKIRVYSCELCDFKSRWPHIKRHMETIHVGVVRMAKSTTLNKEVQNSRKRSASPFANSGDNSSDISDIARGKKKFKSPKDRESGERDASPDRIDAEEIHCAPSGGKETHLFPSDVENSPETARVCSAHRSPLSRVFECGHCKYFTPWTIAIKMHLLGHETDFLKFNVFLGKS